MNLTNGDIIIVRGTDITAEVLSIDGNDLRVRCSSGPAPDRYHWTETWNLEHTIVGFTHHGTYSIQRTLPLG